MAAFRERAERPEQGGEVGGLIRAAAETWQPLWKGPVGM